MADRIVVMNQGVIEQVGTPMEVYRDPATPFVADFVGKINVLPGACTRAGDLRIGAQPLRLRARHRRRARRQGLPAARGRAGAADRAGRRQRLRRRDRQDRVPRLVLPGARAVAERSARSRSRSTCRSTTSPSRASRSAAGCRCGCCPSGCGSSDAPAPRVVSAVLPLPPARALRQRAHWTDRIAHAALLLVALALVVVPGAAAARRSSLKALQDARRRVRRPRQLRRATSRTPALLQSLWQQRLGLGAGHAGHGAARVRLRLRADAQLHAVQGRCSAPSR